VKSALNIAARCEIFPVADLIAVNATFAVVVAQFASANEIQIIVALKIVEVRQAIATWTCNRAVSTPPISYPVKEIAGWRMGARKRDHLALGEMAVSSVV